jgi:hypothetical protein
VVDVNVMDMHQNVLQTGTKKKTEFSFDKKDEIKFHILIIKSIDHEYWNQS